jgi:hypothetical protein
MAERIRKVGRLAVGRSPFQNRPIAFRDLLEESGSNWLIRRDPTGATLYLPGGLEIRKPKTGNAVGTRYYSHAGSTIAVRTPTALTWMVNDHQGTATATVASTASLTVNRRRTVPFGEDRGTKPATWAGDKGYVGGTRDNTGLTHLGAPRVRPLVTCPKKPETSSPGGAARSCRVSIRPGENWAEIQLLPILATLSCLMISSGGPHSWYTSGHRF